VPAGHNAVSQAVAQRAKSAIRGSRSRRTSGRVRKPWVTASIRAPRMSGRASSKSRHIAFSGRRCACFTGGRGQENRTVWLRGIRRRRKLRPGTGSFVGAWASNQDVAGKPRGRDRSSTTGAASGKVTATFTTPPPFSEGSIPASSPWTKSGSFCKNEPFSS
jgi:hypothetical protein